MLQDTHGSVVSGRNLGKRYGEGETAVDALRNINIELAPGSFTAIMGPSGSGKSTLMHLLAGLDQPTSGQVSFGSLVLEGLDDAELTRVRRTRVGFMFQSYNLLPVLSAEENIVLPVRIAGEKIDRIWLEQLLTAFGLQDRRKHRPSELSGGQQQRVALARALITRPTVIFADEPTGNLDSTASDVILTMLRKAVDDLGQTLVIVTHDPVAAAQADRVIYLSDGHIVGEAGPSSAPAILDALKALS